MFPVTGDTYELREQLKAMGCRWEAEAQCWAAPDAATQNSAQALADAEPLRKWREFAGTLVWATGSFTTTAWDAGLRACSLGLSLAEAMQEIGERIRANGGDANERWLQRNVGRAFQHGTPPETKVQGPRVQSPKSFEAESKPVAKPVFAETKLARFAGQWSRVIDTAWLADRSPVDPLTCTSDGFLRALYQGAEQVVICDVFASQGQWLWSREQGFVPSRIDHAAWDGCDPLREQAPPMKGGAAFAHTGPRGIWYLCNPVDGTWGRKGEEDERGRPKWTRRSEPQVTAWRFFALETDEADPREWVAAIAQLPLRIAALYTSGNLGKRNSVHVLIKVDAETKAQFDAWRDLAKRTMIPLGADKGCMSAVRLTRLPGCWREGKDNKQTGQYVPFEKPQPQKLLFLDPEASDVPLIERAAVRDTLGPWERLVSSLVCRPREEEDAIDVAEVMKSLAQFSGERAKGLREELRRWLA